MTLMREIFLWLATPITVYKYSILARIIYFDIGVS